MYSNPNQLRCSYHCQWLGWWPLLSRLPVKNTKNNAFDISSSFNWSLTPAHSNLTFNSFGWFQWLVRLNYWNRIDQWMCRGNQMLNIPNQFDWNERRMYANCATDEKENDRIRESLSELKSCQQTKRCLTPSSVVNKFWANKILIRLLIQCNLHFIWFLWRSYYHLFI